MREKIAAARQLGIRGLTSRFAWRAGQGLRVMAFHVWRGRSSERLASEASGQLRQLPLRSYLPGFEDIRSAYERAPDKEKAGESVDRILAAARQVCAERIAVRGSGEVQLVFERRNWYAYERGTAIMLNRHDFLLPLVQAHVLQDDAAAREKLRELFAYWVDNFDLQRLRECDTPIDAAIRLLNWAWVLNSNILALDDRRSAQLLRIIALQLEYVYAWQSAGGNHLVLEALAVYVYGGLLQGGRAARWRSWGRSTLLRQLLRQTTDDGVHTEQSMFYHQAVTTHYLKFFLAADHTGDRIGQAYRDRFGRMLDYVHDTAKPGLGHPVLGDGEALVTDDREHWESRALLAARFTMFSRPVYERLLPMIDDSSVWLLQQWAGQVATSPDEPRTRVFEGAGIAVLRGDNTYALLDAAPFSDPEFPHHGHADALSVEISAGEDDLFVDPGGYGYYDDDFRRFFRSTAAHNTITVGNRDQSELFGVLGYGRLCKSQLVRYEINEEHACVVASHDGYRPAIHQRSLYLTRKPHQCLVIADWLENLGGQPVVSRLHAAPDCEVDLDGMRVIAGGRRAYRVGCDATTDLVQRTLRGEKNSGLQGWVSPETHEATPATTWEIALDGAPSCALVTVVALEPDLDVSVAVRDTEQANLAIGTARFRLQREASGYRLERLRS